MNWGSQEHRRLPFVIDALAPLMLGIDWMNPEWLLTQFGNELFWIGALIIFIECGLLFPILPGDTLLFAVGIFIKTGELNVDIGFALVIYAAAAFAGNVAGFEIGRGVGSRLFQRNGRFLNMENYNKSHEFFQRHGNKALVIGRFVPLIRTFVTLVAGAANMERHKFWIWSAVGAVAWVVAVTMLGYALGNITFLRQNIEGIILLAVAMSVIPIAWEWWRQNKRLSRDR